MLPKRKGEESDLFPLFRFTYHFLYFEQQDCTGKRQ